MSFDYTDHEYLPQCTDGCGAVTSWLPSREMAEQVAKNHAKGKGHNLVVRERLK